MATSTAAIADSTATQSVVIITITSSRDTSQETAAPVVVTAYSTVQYTPSATATTTSSRTTTSSTATARQSSTSSGGLGTAGTIAISVAVPVVVLAILLGAGILLWRRRRRNKTALAQRKEEHDQYSFHPNANSFAPAVTTQYGNDTNNSQSYGQSHAYRGWQATDTTGLPIVPSGYQPGRGSNAGIASEGTNETLTNNSDAHYLEKPTLPALANMDDLESVDGEHSRHQDWNLLSPGHGSPPLNALNASSPTSNYSTHENQTRQNSGEDYGYSNRAAQFMPSLQQGHERPVSNAFRDRSYFDS